MYIISLRISTPMLRCAFKSGTGSQARKLNYSLRRLYHPTVNLPLPELDYAYLCNPKLTNEIRENVRSRKLVGDIDKVVSLHEFWKNSGYKDDIKHELLNEAKQIPNQSHPRIMSYGKDPVVVSVVGNKQKSEFKPKPFHKLAEAMDSLRTNRLGIATGSRSYYLKGALANLEAALIRCIVNLLLKKGFHLVSVPDLLHPSVIEGCGMNVKGDRTQVYALNPDYYGDVCLSGTAEMALASLYVNTVIRDLSLPVRLAAVSRCHRAEISSGQEENGIFRVHHFTKVEMFGITKAETGLESSDILDEFVTIQKDIFSSLGLHFQLLDMPPHELGAPAYRKFDIEAWMPGRQMYGEISSASNCTDYQSRRLHIRYQDVSGGHKFAHTVNGTACAIPRMLIALLETHQQMDGSIAIPAVLTPYLGVTSIAVNKKVKLQHLTKE